MQDIRQSAHREIREYDDSESGSASSECGSDNQPHNEDITIEINGDVHMDSGPQHALEATFSPRSYQLEMLEESLRRNIIVAVRLSAAVTYTRLFNTSADGYWQRQNAYSQQCFFLCQPPNCLRFVYMLLSRFFL